MRGGSSVAAHFSASVLRGVPARHVSVLHASILLVVCAHPAGSARLVASTHLHFVHLNLIHLIASSHLVASTLLAASTLLVASILLASTLLVSALLVSTLLIGSIRLVASTHLVISAHILGAAAHVPGARTSSTAWSDNIVGRIVGTVGTGGKGVILRSESDGIPRSGVEESIGIVRGVLSLNNSSKLAVLRGLLTEDGILRRRGVPFGPTVIHGSSNHPGLSNGVELTRSICRAS